MVNYFTRKNLLQMLGLLVTLKFALIPLLDWQSEKIMELEAKQEQVLKSAKVVENRQKYQSVSERMVGHMKKATNHFYFDSNSLKLTIQKDMEKIFEINGLTLSGFNWILESGEQPNRFRARLSFSGTQANMIKTFWALGAYPKFIRIVESRQKMTSDGPRALGVTQGNFTLEFYTVNSNFIENGASLREETSPNQDKAI